MRLPLILVLSTLPLMAAPVSFSLSGTVTQVDALLAGSFSVGQAVVGLYQFESSTPDAALPDPASGVYFNAGPLFTATAGALKFTATTVNITVNNLPSADVYRVEGSTASGPGVGGFAISSLVLSLTDNAPLPPDALASDALPLLAPALAPFNVRTLTFTFVSGATVASVVAQVDTLSTSVPEPALVLPFLGLLLSVSRLRRVRRGRRPY